MNQIFNWLLGAGRAAPKLEAKHNTLPLVALHGAGEPAWSLLEAGNFEARAFCTNPVVYRCVRLISEACASLPWLVGESAVESDSHPVLDLLDEPNARQAGPAFMEALYGYLLLSGETYINAAVLDGLPTELHLLPPQNVTAVCDERGWPVAFDYSVGASRTRYQADGDKPEILHIALFNPGSELQGHSPLGAAHMSVDIHNAASSWNKALLDNSARPSGALVYAPGNESNLSQEQFDRLKHELEDGYAGASRAGRPMLLEGGLDWKAMGYSPRDMDFLEAKNGAAREIALAFGVPPMLLGIPGDNTYSNYREANRAFWMQTALPLAKRTGAQLGRWLSRFGPDAISLVPSVEGLEALARDREALWSQLASADFLTANEKRHALGYPPLETANDED